MTALQTQIYLLPERTHHPQPVCIFRRQRARAGAASKSGCLRAPLIGRSSAEATSVRLNSSSFTVSRHLKLPPSALLSARTTQFATLT